VAQAEAIKQGHDQVVFLDAAENRWIEELGGMNLFFVYQDGHVVTPALDGTILRGITRDSVVQLIKDRGLAIEERKITLDELRTGLDSGDIVEVFACGTAAVITPIGQFKSREGTIGSADAEAGELTASLRAELTGIQYGTVADRHGWMVKLAD
jgi:branched-chain amino acid aminotransferase